MAQSPSSPRLSTRLAMTTDFRVISVAREWVYCSSSDGSWLRLEPVMEMETGVLLGPKLVYNIPIAMMTDDLFTVEMTKENDFTRQRH